MSFVNVLTNDKIVLAFVLFGLGAIGLPIFEFYLRKKFNSAVSRSIMWIDLAASFARVIIVGGFVYFCYPTIFGLSVAPSVEYLQRNNVSHFGSDFAFLALFVISILASSATRWKFILPFQSCLATTYVFFELTRYLGVTTAYAWPGLNVVLTIGVIAYVADRVAVTISAVGNQCLVAKFGFHDYYGTIGQIFGVLAQAPIIMLFAYGLGQQIAI